MLKIYSAFTVLAVVFLAALTVGVLSFYKLEPISDSFVSPNGRYRIDLRGEKDQPMTPFSFNHIVTAEISVEDRSFGRTQINIADWPDSGFDQTYQKFRWHQEDVFGFHRVADHEPATRQNGDSLTITNTTSRKLDFVNAGFGINKFLVLDLHPYTSRTVYLKHKMAPEYIYATAKFSDGSVFVADAVNFSEKEKKAGERLYRYCASIHEDRFVINSIDLVGTVYSKETLRVPRITVCGD